MYTPLCYMLCSSLSCPFNLIGFGSVARFLKKKIMSVIWQPEANGLNQLLSLFRDSQEANTQRQQVKEFFSPCWRSRQLPVLPCGLCVCVCDRRWRLYGVEEERCREVWGWCFLKMTV